MDTVVDKNECLYIIIPAFNEETNIRHAIEQWNTIAEKVSASSRLVIVDDGSQDNTCRILKEAAFEKSQLVVLTKGNEGHGATVLYGYQYALEHEADFVFQTDSDGQTDPEEFWKFWEIRNQYDLIIGNRTDRGDGFSRRLVTRVLKYVIRVCFKVNTADANTPFRLMSAESLKENIQLIPDRYGLSNVLLTVIYEKKHQDIKYLPVTFKPRQGGKNSINMRSITKIGFQAVKDFKKLNINIDIEIQKQADKHERVVL